MGKEDAYIGTLNDCRLMLAYLQDNGMPLSTEMVRTVARIDVRLGSLKIPTLIGIERDGRQAKIDEQKLYSALFSKQDEGPQDELSLDICKLHSELLPSISPATLPRLQCIYKFNAKSGNVERKQPLIINIAIGMALVCLLGFILTLPKLKTALKNEEKKANTTNVSAVALKGSSNTTNAIGAEPKSFTDDDLLK